MFVCLLICLLTFRLYDFALVLIFGLCDGALMLILLYDLQERVPCIVCLEVVDYSKNKGSNLENSQNANTTLSERALVKDWCESKRPAQQHNTLLSKVHSLTRKRLQKLCHDIADTIQNLDIPDVFNTSTNEFRHTSCGDCSSFLPYMDLSGTNHDTITNVEKPLQITRNEFEISTKHQNVSIL